MRDKVRAKLYIVTLHAHEEMADDDLTVYDVEHTILTGRVVERQRDAKTTEWKYRVRGMTPDGDTAEVVAKLGVTGKLVIITVYAL
jgi:hypothetical protein